MGSSESVLSSSFSPILRAASSSFLGHNISLCPKNEEEAALKIGENEDDSTDSEDEEMEDYTANRESVNVITRGRESTKPRDKERPRKEGKETKDEDNQNGRRPKRKTTKMEDDQNGR